MRQPQIVDSVLRGKTSSKLVWNLFADRPWVLDIRETVQNGTEDEHGYDMFVKVVALFGNRMKIGAKDYILPVQIKSSDRSVKAFFYKYSKEHRFFNKVERSHQFILCGMEEKDVVLADLVGQIVVHTSNFMIEENDVLNFLSEVGDREAVDAYKRHKTLMLFRWYGTRLPPL